MIVKIDDKAGFCFGVVSAINIVEKELEKKALLSENQSADAQTNKLYCLGDIVHNDMEVNRLASKGLEVVNLETMSSLTNTKVIIRAHGEPPSTYMLAKQNNIEIIDATCPIVLKLQENVRKGFENMLEKEGQVVIFGKKGHAEVIGLEGQTKNTAIVVSDEKDLDLINLSKSIHIFSQTTMNREKYKTICSKIVELYKENNTKADLIQKQEGLDSIYLLNDIEIIISDSICNRVSLRSSQILDFADQYDIIIFVSGRDSSNGMYLYNLCKQHKSKTYLISNPNEIDLSWFEGCKSVGISGATSTPMWLMEEILEICLSID